MLKTSKKGNKTAKERVVRDKNEEKTQVHNAIGETSMTHGFVGDW